MSDDKIIQQKLDAEADGNGNKREPLPIYRGANVGNPEGYHAISLHELNAASIRGLQAVEPGQKSTPVLVPVDAAAAPAAAPVAATPASTPAPAPAATPAPAGDGKGTAVWGGTPPTGK